ncbi:MAG TPA: sugar ABC transporter substrate-binding protein [Devosiaceae bacterium]|nr:sugar ABC transporter substrate-binding protein [Devosiaceae bacterium]
MKYTYLIGMVAGLMTSTAAFADPVTIQFWDNQQTESGLSQYQQAAVERFEKENPDIKVQVTTVPYPEYQQRLLTAVQGGNAPDVATLDQIWVAAFAKAGAIAPLDDVAAKAGVKAETFFKGAWDSANYDGHLWGIPFNVDVWSFTYYNNKLFKDAGVDPSTLSTWDGFKAAADKLTGNGKYGIGLFAGKGEDTVVVLDSYIFSNGGKVLNDDGSCALTSDESVGALKYLQTLVKDAPSGLNNANSGNMRELFLNQSLATEFWPALEQPTLQKSSLDWDFLPGTAPEGKTPIGTYGGWNLAIFKSSPQQEAAWKFIQFLTREDVNGDVVDLIPANVNAAKAFLDKNRKSPDKIMQLLNAAAPRPLSPRYLEVSDIEVTLAQDVYAGKDATQAAKEACDKINALK